MSRYADEQYEAYVEEKRTALKDHVCGACGLTIPKRSQYFNICIVYEGVERIKRCIRCQAMHEYLRTLSPDMWPDEKLNCGEEFEQHWGYKPPEWLAGLAFWQPGEKLPAREPCARWKDSYWSGKPPVVCYQYWGHYHLGACCTPFAKATAKALHQEPCS